MDHQLQELLGFGLKSKRLSWGAHRFMLLCMDRDSYKMKKLSNFCRFGVKIQREFCGNWAGSKASRWVLVPPMRQILIAIHSVDIS
jgi:hypothetical protein